jgi:hypothetical protein
MLYLQIYQTYDFLVEAFNGENGLLKYVSTRGTLEQKKSLPSQLCAVDT